MVARYFFELLILYLFLNIIHVEKINNWILSAGERVNWGGEILGFEGGGDALNFSIREHFCLGEEMSAWGGGDFLSSAPLYETLIFWFLITNNHHTILWNYIHALILWFNTPQCACTWQLHNCSTVVFRLSTHPGFFFIVECKRPLTG